MHQQPALDSWGFALLLLRRLGLPPGIVPTQLSIELSSGRAVTVPIFPPSIGDIEPSVLGIMAPKLSNLQRRILDVLYAAEESVKGEVLARNCELENRRSLYRPGGLTPLIQQAIIEKRDGGYCLTPEGADLAASLQADTEED